MSKCAACTFMDPSFEHSYKLQIKIVHHHLVWPFCARELHACIVVSTHKHTHTLELNWIRHELNITALLQCTLDDNQTPIHLAAYRTFKWQTIERKEAEKCECESECVFAECICIIVQKHTVFITKWKAIKFININFYLLIVYKNEVSIGCT